MAEFTLKRTFAFGQEPFRRKWDGFFITECSNHSTVSIACGEPSQEPAATGFERVVGLRLPSAGNCNQNDETLVVLAVRNQWLVSSIAVDYNTLRHELKSVAAVSDQSDGLVALDIGGDKAVSVMEKLCPLDLHNDVFPIGAAARSAFEGMPATIAKTADNQYRLFIAGSSRRSFLDNLIHAAQSTCS